MAQTLTGRSIPAIKIYSVRSHSDHDSRLQRLKRRLFICEQNIKRSLSNHRPHKFGENHSIIDNQENQTDQHHNQEEDDNSSVSDPHYKIFLENLRADGKSYVFEFQGKVVKYEAILRCNETASDLNSSGEWIEWRSETASDLVDRDYMIYLKNLNDDGELADGKDERDSKSAFRINGMAKNGGKSTRLNQSVRCTARAQFREKVMDILRVPYDEKEYGELLHEISERKMLQSFIELRGQSIPYSENWPGKSFLDHHKDLARKIDMVRCDRPRVLNLMQGFFFWLKNLSHEGAVCPWLDLICLEVVPQAE